MDNDDGLGSDDAAALRLSEEEYAEDFPGLLGSWYWHANMDCTEAAGEPVDIDWLDHFAQGEDCCFSDCDYGACLTDTDTDGDVDLSDLALLLSNYGATTGMLVEDGNFDRDADVDISDLAELLSRYGEVCGCFGGADGGVAAANATVPT